MARTWEFNDPIDFPAEKVFAVISDPGFIEKWTLVQAGQKPKAELLLKTADKVQIKLSYEEPLPLGIGVMQALMEIDWDVHTFTNDWRRKSAGRESRAKVEGRSRLAPQGPNRCIFHEEGTIDISLPIIGGKLEKIIIDHMTKGRRSKVDFLVQEVKRRG